jgi:energy-coupling factor transporter ATP-binding protein EcfA2
VGLASWFSWSKLLETFAWSKKMHAMNFPMTSGVVDQDGFETWLGQRHKWLQTAANQLIQNKKMPNEQELTELVNLAINEASGKLGNSFTSITPGSFAQALLSPKLQIRGLLDIQGVNAIKNGASLKFGQSNLAVIYGPNGSGKSGFSRILKQACGSRAKEELLSNVFEDISRPPTGKIIVSVDGAVEESLDWSAQAGLIEKLRHVHVFDSPAASMYVAKKNEATYEPHQMRFVSYLIKICDQVNEYLTKENQKLIKSLPQLPGDITATPSATWLTTLKAGMDQASIDKACAYPKELDDERVAKETALAEKNIEGRLQAISLKNARRLTKSRPT